MGEEKHEEYERELAALVESQQAEFKKKTNPLFAKMHAMTSEEVEELKGELMQAHERQKKELASRYGVPFEEA